ncbi:MAG: Gfo/Idh/MocA family oxidoreductase [Verrucomicrobiota bacterium]|nr:Gfo/Idh/MocA family oxidoreductase [Verrucomicrobiota bacterium]
MKANSSRISRRRFISTNVGATVAACAVPAFVPSTVLGAQGRVAPSNRINVGCIGVGPQGRGVMGNFLAQSDCRVVALCDVLKRNLNAALEMVNKHYQDKSCVTYSDYKELLGRSDIDAVLIATPDHWHVPVAVAAARANKDIYLEKPMGVSVEEGQILRRVCQQQKRIFQFGTQQRSSGQFRLACELVRNGRIGKLRQITVWCSASRPGGPTKPILPPSDLDYETWLGPARETPYTQGKSMDEQDAWKTWWYNYDYALGFVAGWGIHPLDIAYWGHPEMMKGVLEVEGRGVFPTEGACNTAIAWEVNYFFADGVRMLYRGTRNGYDKVIPMNDFTDWERKYGKIVDHGTAFEGTDGWVLVDRTQIRTSPESLVETKFGSGDVQLTRSSNHVRNFLDSIRSRQPAICPIEDSVQGDILCHLADIAMRLERKLKWDGQKEKFVGDSEANRRLRMRTPRREWRWV